MPSGFKTFGEEEFDRVFIKETEIIDRFVGQRLWGWGENTTGQLGDGTSTTKSSPVVALGGATNWAQVSIGGGTGTGIGIKTDGTLWTWGHNQSGQLGIATSGAGTHTSSPAQTAGGGTNWKQGSSNADATFGSSYAVKTDGTLWTWGQNSIGQLGDNTTTARSSPGTTIGGGTNWKFVSGGTNFVAAIKTDGTLWAWGAGGLGQLGDNTVLSKRSPITTAGGGTNWKQVSCGEDHTAAVKTDGTLWTWGTNTDGQLGTGNISLRSSPGTTAGGGTNWKQVSCGTVYTAAVKTDGTLWTWGRNSFGQLGNGNVTARSSPGTTAGGGTNWKQVSCGYRTAAAVKTDGTLWTWGNGLTGVLGDNTIASRSSPSTVIGNSNWKQISVGFNQQMMAIGD